MNEPVFKPPVLTSAAQRAAEDFAARVDVWRTANTLLRGAGAWEEDITPTEVLALARWLANDDGG